MFAKRPSSPTVQLDGSGYPGSLSAEEFDECRKFLRLLKEQQTTRLKEQIYSFADIEDPEYTICRWVRGSKFHAAAMMQRCLENQEMYERAQAHEFYPDVSAAIGAPFSVFLSQYPFLAVGRAKNGCPVNYFQAGRINPEGMMCLTTAEQLEGFFWWSFMHKMKSEIREAKRENPNFVLCEGVNVIDLKGLSRAALSADTMQVIKLASKISDFYPEVR